MNPKRKTTGIRVPDHQICQSLLQALGNPIISSSAHSLDEEGNPLTLDLEKAKLFDSLEKHVDIIIDDGSELGFEVSTILDLTTDEPAIVRQGLGWDELQELLMVAG
jgi:tRNA threonylcarbamoyl adenosine modification protein (Sua5/YciO/YrdC/YwlC family)